MDIIDNLGVVFFQESQELFFKLRDFTGLDIIQKASHSGIDHTDLK